MLVSPNSIVQVFVSNAPPIAVAESLQEAEAQGTVADAIGFGAWGVEQTSIVTIQARHVESVLTDLAFGFPNEDYVFLIGGGVGDSIALDDYRADVSA